VFGREGGEFARVCGFGLRKSLESIRCFSELAGRCFDFGGCSLNLRLELGYLRVSKVNKSLVSLYTTWVIWERAHFFVERRKRSLVSLLLALECGFLCRKFVFSCRSRGDLLVHLGNLGGLLSNALFQGRDISSKLRHCIVGSHKLGLENLQLLGVGGELRRSSILESRGAS